MCIYHDKTKIMRLFDVSQSASPPVVLETPMLCAVIGCRDDQIFYLRLQKSPQRLGLFRRLIQGMKISSEVLVTTDLSNFGTQADFSIACRDEDSTQVLVITSTQGICKSYRLSFDERESPA